jgi:hypothetical protein
VDVVALGKNGTTSEFMIEGDIDLEDCTDLKFIEHRNRICRLDGSCTDRASPTHRIAGQVIAFLLGHGIHCVDHVLKKPSGYEGRRPLDWAVDLGIDGITRALGTKKERFGGAIRPACANRRSSRVADDWLRQECSESTGQEGLDYDDGVSGNKRLG